MSVELIFTIEEFRTVVHALRAQFEARGNRQQSDPLAALLERFLARDFGFGIDELETLHEALEDEGRRLKDPATHLSQEERDALPQTQRVLEHVIDKVVEACAMV